MKKEIFQNYGSHTFPVHRLLHQDGKKHPVIVFINIDKHVPDKYFPIEEITEQEFDIITYCYTDITSDDGDFTTGIAPRNVCVNAAELDYWADQKSEQLCCLAASEAWENMGLDGIEKCDHFLTAGEKLLQGNVGFFMAPTKHFLSRHAWNNYMEFMRIHRHN